MMRRSTRSAVSWNFVDDCIGKEEKNGESIPHLHLSAHGPLHKINKRYRIRQRLPILDNLMHLTCGKIVHKREDRIPKDHSLYFCALGGYRCDLSLNSKERTGIPESFINLSFYHRRIKRL